MSTTSTKRPIIFVTVFFVSRVGENYYFCIGLQFRSQFFPIVFLRVVVLGAVRQEASSRRNESGVKIGFFLAGGFLKNERKKKVKSLKNKIILKLEFSKGGKLFFCLAIKMHF